GRIAMSLLMWRCALDIRYAQGGLWRLAKGLEPHIFVVFCSHMLTVLIVAFFCRRLGLSPEDVVYPLIFLGQLALLVLVGVALSKAGQKYAPRLLALAAGKRGS
ncbi:hypothetical protein, partial [Neotabrizicola sp. sgz301269]|uniref:hypothetical protein n=1 Tax=Neotabrizicola sp. sgz301269 TaxID=3276282 RepID=UPI00376FAC35